MKGFIVYPTYRIIEDKAYVYLFGSLENGESFLTINHFRPYFYIRTKDKSKLKKIKTDLKYDIEDTSMKTFFEDKVSKITLNMPRDVPVLRDMCNKEDIVTYEADIRFTYRFMMDKGIKGSTDIKGNYKKGNYVNRIYEEPELYPIEFKPKLKVLSIDIETSSDLKNLYAVSLVSKDFGKVLIISDKKLNRAESFKTEPELLERFKEIIHNYDPDIITGWNLIDFDLKILKEKFDEHKIPFVLGRAEWPGTIKTYNSFFKSSTADIAGRMVLDAMHLLRSSFISLTDYKLQTAAEEILGESKLDLFKNINKGQEIERLFKEEPQKLVNYNLKDSQLVIEILEKKGLIDLTVQRSLLTGMQLDRVKGSIASLDNLYIRETMKKGYVCPTGKYKERSARIKGGFVKESIPGIYDYIIVLDFKSLYPSIIRTFNIDPLSFIPKEFHNKYKKTDVIEAPNGTWFKKEYGILPMLIQRLWEQRDKAKKRNNKEESYAIKITMNSFFGVLANPMCRFYNIDIANAITHFGQFIVKKTAELVEKKGYKVIYGDSVGKDTEIVIQKNNKPPEYVKIQDLFKKQDKKIGEKEYNLKTNIKVLTLDKKGKSVFKNIKYVMRHKADKKIYRISFTNSWYIDVTEDHSLIGYINKQKNNRIPDLNRLIELKPKEIGDKAKSIITIKKIPSGKINSKKYPKEFYEFLGFFIGDGSFNSQNKNNYYLHLAGGIDSKEIISKIIVPLQKKGFIKNYWKKKKGDICVNGLKLINILNKDCRNNKQKIIPSFLFSENNENIAAFLRGLFSADGTVIIRNSKPIIRFTNTREDFIQQTTRLLLKIGIANSFFKENKKNKYKGKENNTVSNHIYIKSQEEFARKISFIQKRKKERLKLISENSTHKRTIKKYDFDLSKVIKVKELEYDDYVYDIEVENVHRFFANNVLVHNTDSIFLETKVNTIKKSESVGREIQDYINLFWQDYIKKEYGVKNFLELEFEKTYIRFMMPRIRGTEKGAKKRYAGLLIKDGNKKIDFTGLEFVRRDWTDLSKKFQLELLDRIFNKKEVVDYIKDFVKNLKKGKYDNLLIYRKAIRKNLKEYVKTTPPHVKAARKLKKLTSNIITYVMTTDGPEPTQAQKHNLDYEHYIDKQLKPIADSILVFYNKKFDDLLKNSKQTSLFGFS